MTTFTQPDPTWQYKYVTSQPRPTDPQRPIFGLPSVGSGVVADAYQAVAVPTPTRTHRLKSEQHVSTELYGTSPYLGRGDGIMFHVDTSTSLREGISVLRGDKVREYVASRWDFVGVPLAVQDVSEQIGEQARLAGVYE